MENSRAVRADLFDPASLASLGHVEIIARWVVDGFLTGLHRSPKKGFSVEFAEYRGYQPGDDLRFIDWKIAARANKWVVKQFEEETNLRATIILDVSRSMAWSSAPTHLTKLRYAEQLVAALSLLLIRQRDAVGFIRYDDRLRSVIPPKARTAQWRRILHALEEEGAGLASIAPATPLEAALVACSRRYWRQPVRVQELLDTQLASGGWPAAALYHGGRARRRDGSFEAPHPDTPHWGSEELTTAFCIEALSRPSAS